MRLGRPLAAASVMAAAIGASLAASPALADNSLAFKFAEDQQNIVSPSDPAFTVSGTGCTGKDAAVGIALYSPKGDMSTVVTATPDAEGNWSTALNIPELVKSTGVEAKTDGSADGWSIVAGCVAYGEAKGQVQEAIAFDDTKVEGTYEVTTDQNGVQKITVDVKGFSPNEEVTLTLVSKNDPSKTYPVGKLKADANGNVTGELPAPSDVPDGEYTLTIEGARYGEGGSSNKTVVIKGGSLSLVADGDNGIGDNGGATANPTAPASNGSVNVPASTNATPAASTSGKPLAKTGANGLLFGGIAAALVAIGGGVLVVRRRKA
ncbi:peptidase [Actinomyces sp. HMSC075C01]|uniref:Peptidase n=1 Tax=Actinomyces oris TaxID=544580 RepID=A0A1Q8W0Y2_9ACTO|nr:MULTISPECIES: LPXTG cell wall anchor domain-containing protein [Actinomyces]OFR55196.1 peptidase [Actinomyces sp. HMSC075C01]OLO54660.1 peptidase [Actinomyces oris]